MSVLDDAVQVESLLPSAMTLLFHVAGEDPLRHHSVGQVRLLRALAGGSKTATSLARSAGLSASSLTQMVSRLITAGLVEKRLDEQDRRVRVLALSATGRLLMESRRMMRVEAAIRIMEGMDEASRHRLIHCLRQVLEAGAGFSAAPEEVLA